MSKFHIILILFLIGCSNLNVTVSAKQAEEFQLNNFDRKNINHDGQVKFEEFSRYPIIPKRLDQVQNGFISRKENIPKPITTSDKMQPFILPAHIKTLVDIEYVEGGGKAQSLDILQAFKSDHKPMPVLVFIHGGAYKGGDKHDGWEYLLPFAEKGYLGVSINYRFSNQAVFPAQIEDCKSAIRYLRAHADKFNLDPMRIGVWGVSAGGHLAALLGTSSGVPELENGPWQEYSTKVQAVCDWYGPSDFLRMDLWSQRRNTSSPESQLFGGLVAQKIALAKMASPLLYIDEDDPPFLIMHGTEDRIIPYEHSILLAKGLENAGVPVKFISLEGVDHGEEEFESKEILQKVFDFFDTTLR